MFKTVRRIILWCGSFRTKLFLGFACGFFSTLFTALPIALAARLMGKLIEAAQKGVAFDSAWIWRSVFIMVGAVTLRFFFDFLRARFQEAISYELVARDRLAIGDALKRVSLGYFQKMNTGSILNAITTGLHSLENMGMRMVDTFVGGYLNFLCIFLFLLVVSPKVSLIAVMSVVVSFLFMLKISQHSTRTAPVSDKTNRSLTEATIEYVRGLPVIKSFGQEGVAVQSIRKACQDSRDIHLKIEWGYVPSNGGHLLALKLGSVALAGAAFYLGIAGQMALPTVLVLAFLSFSIFASLEPISDSAHVLSIIDNALNQLEALRETHYIDQDGRNIELLNHDIVFSHVTFGYDERPVIRDVSFAIPEKTTTAIIGPSGSGKTTLCNLLARFYDVSAGNIYMGGHDVREFTCDSLLSNIAMVFQNVYLFHDTIRANICFGKSDATEEEIIIAAKKARCHDFINALPNGYDTIIGEGGSTLSGGERQRISIARAMLKDAPVIILDEATASIDPENEHLIQGAISELTRGKTIIIIAHRLATIEHADQILVLKEGRVAEKGTHKELIQQNGLYSRFTDIRRRAEEWKLK